MTKADLVAVMAEASGTSKAAAERALEAFLRAVRESLRRGRRVTLVGFGTFSVVRRRARNGRDPRSGLAIKIPAARIPRFRPGRDLRRVLR